MEKLIKKHILVLISSSIVFIYLVITLPAWLGSNHFLFNLEPYPDGLLYALSGRNIAMGRDFGLFYRDAHLQLWVPPLYSLVLATGYFVHLHPSTFYLVNTTLGALTVLGITYFVHKITKNPLAAFVAGVVYVAHAYIIWLPSVPMTENISLFIFTYALLTLLQNKTTIQSNIGMGILILGLILTRYANIVTSGLFFLLLIVKNRVNLYFLFQKQKQVLLLGTLIALIAVLTGLYRSGVLQLLISTGIRFVSALINGSRFYSFQFLVSNITSYSSIVLGFPHTFLWLRTALTSPFLLLSSCLTWVYLFRSQNNLFRWQSLVLFGAFLSLFPVLLVFYYVDSRYVIHLIPILAVTLGLGFNQLQQKKSLVVAIVVSFLLLTLHATTQISLYKEILINNWLHRSQAWQYQAIQSFNTSLPDQALLITALPPFLVDAYQEKPYRVLPLSPAQEFLQKEEYVWGDDVPYSDLLVGYEKWLEEGRELYISNAYVTHQQAVIADFEAFKERFYLQLVSEGCLQACNLYRLQLKPVSSQN